MLAEAAETEENEMEDEDTYCTHLLAASLIE